MSVRRLSNSLLMPSNWAQPQKKLSNMRNIGCMIWRLMRYWMIILSALLGMLHPSCMNLAVLQPFVCSCGSEKSLFGMIIAYNY